MGKWDEVGDSELILLPLPTTAVNAAAIAINNAGTIVGYYETAGSKPIACPWEPTGASFEFVDLGTSGVARRHQQFRPNRRRLRHHLVPLAMWKALQHC